MTRRKRRGADADWRDSAPFPAWRDSAPFPAWRDSAPFPATKIALAVALGAVMAAQTPIMPMTGRDVPALAPYETALKPILEKWSIPGAALAITDQGRLVYARSFGYADKEAQIPVQPYSLFRFASISKTLTGMTIVKLAEEGRLNLDAKFMDLLPNLTPIPALAFDARMRNITVRMMLQHTGGWNKDVPNDWVLQFTLGGEGVGRSLSDAHAGDDVPLCH